MRLLHYGWLACLLLGILPLASYADDATTAPASTQPSEKLTWAPPPLTNPIDFYITESNYTSIKLDQSKDYVLHMPSTPLINRGGIVSIWGGHNVVLIGGEVHVPKDAKGWAGGFYIHFCTGTFHLEGVAVTGEDQALKEGINLDERYPGSMVQIENVRVGIAYGSFKTNHAQCIQTWAGPPALRIDHFTGHTTYQGFFLLPDQHAPGQELRLFDFRNVNLWGGGFVLWIQSDPPVPLHTENIWIKSDPKRWPNLTLWPQGSSDTIWKGVKPGDPPDGDFVPEGVAGCGYHSPGYLSDYVPPPPVPSTQPSPDPH